MTKGMAFRFMVVSLLLALMAFVVQLAVADDEGENTKIEIKAPLEAVNCAGVPPTITVLGLVIDIGQAKIENDEEEDDDVNEIPGVCADLVVGHVVEVRLASDLPNTTTGLLTALKVEEEGEDCDDDDCVEVEAPIQAVDQIGQTITVLGLVIDISHAEIEGDDDDDEGEGGSQADASQLIVGQFVEVELASSQAPFVADEIEIKNFGNEVELEVVDADGNEVEDDDDDVEIQVTVTATASAPAPGVKAPSKGGKKVLKFHARSNGSTVLNGLPTGAAKVVVTRLRDGRKSTAKASAKILGQDTTHLLVRLKRAR